MKSIAERIASRLGVDGESPFADRTPRAIAQTMFKAAPMAVRGLWWKLWLRRCGGLALIGRRVAIRNPQDVTVGRRFVAEDDSEIQGLSKRGVRFGDGVTIGRFAMIRPSGYYMREIGEGMIVGDRSNVGPYCYVGCSGYVEIGDDVLMSPRVSLFGENHNAERVDVPIRDQGVTRAGIVVEDDCWLASGCTILAGVRIGRGSIVAAGAVVTRDVPPFCVVGGVPARVLRSRRVDERGR